MNKKKMLARIINNHKNVQFNDFVTVVESFGFLRKRGEGSHNIFRKNNIAEHINLQNVDGKAKPYQIKQFLALIEKYNLTMED